MYVCIYIYILHCVLLRSTHVLIIRVYCLNMCFIYRYTIDWCYISLKHIKTLSHVVNGSPIDLGCWIGSGNLDLEKSAVGIGCFHQQNKMCSAWGHLETLESAIGYRYLPLFQVFFYVILPNSVVFWVLLTLAIHVWIMFACVYIYIYSLIGCKPQKRSDFSRTLRMCRFRGLAITKSFSIFASSTRRQLDYHKSATKKPI